MLQEAKKYTEEEIIIIYDCDDEPYSDDWDWSGSSESWDGDDFDYPDSPSGGYDDSCRE